MTQTVTLALPDPLVQTARSEAVRTKRPVEDVLLEWLDRAAAHAAIEALSDDRVLALRDEELAGKDQEKLAELLERQREGQLLKGDRQRLDALLVTYRRALLRKAKALTVAVDRGLQAPLGTD